MMEYNSSWCPLQELLLQWEIFNVIIIRHQNEFEALAVDRIETMYKQHQANAAAIYQDYCRLLLLCRLLPLGFLVLLLFHADTSQSPDLLQPQILARVPKATRDLKDN
mmetsp:Transcript_8131/g.11880  ORF Transcript_8131/g.11880 Transcript_8131/m.11880 type:complete len:108 (-) Transcript_8131:797-1120(-)